MSERDRMFGSTQGKGDTPRPTDLKKYRSRFPSSMGKKKKNKIHSNWTHAKYFKGFLIPKRLWNKSFKKE